MITKLHEKLPNRVRRHTPQFIKDIYAQVSVTSRKIFVYSHFWISEDEINEWFKDKTIFFILSIGRSGTKWLASLLNTVPRALVVHEPFIETKPHQEAFHSEEKAYRYIIGFRKKEIYLRVKNLDIDTYGEVNSFLRRHIKALKKVFPNAIFIHLVRDGRDVVRSMYSRETMLPNAYDTKMIYPTKDDPFYEKWKTMTRFEKLCWYWMIENRYLRTNIGRIVQFESIISDYGYFKKYVLQPLNLNIPEEKWAESIKRPKNISKTYKLPHWTKWSYEMRKTFERICEDEMKKCGYTLKWED